MSEDPQCFDCRHFSAESGTCAAFPTGIPRRILDNEIDHRKPVAGDGGIRFEPITNPGRSQAGDATADRDAGPDSTPFSR